MTRLLTLILVGVAASTAACAFPAYEADPVSPQQWERRQEQIERREAERVRLCRITKDKDPSKPELCRGVPGDQD